MVQLNFNAHEVEPPGDFDPLPEGKYSAVIAASDLKRNGKGTGDYLELEFIVLAGPYKGRKVWIRLNINNQNPTAQEIARGHLSAVCRAVGVMTPRDSSELHNLPLAIYVKCKPRGDGNGLTNDITRFEPPVGVAAVASAPPPTTPVPAAAAGAPPPWTT